MFWKAPQRTYWYCYIVRCNDGSLYTDIAPDVQQAVSYLNNGCDNTYVKPRQPVFLAYREEFMNEKDALRRAEGIRALPATKKEQLVSSVGFGSIEDLGLAT